MQPLSGTDNLLTHLLSDVVSTGPGKLRRDCGCARAAGRTGCTVRLAACSVDVRAAHRPRAAASSVRRNSFNARVREEWVGDVTWGDVKLLAEAADVLMASGLPVDAKSDDFEAFFPQMALPEFELWLHTQLIDSRGGEINFRSDFGAAHLPPKTSRANYNVTEIIDTRIWEQQQQRLWALQPWSRELVAAAEDFEQARKRQVQVVPWRCTSVGMVRWWIGSVGWRL